MIDTVHSYGSCVSYDELRRFLTSAAENELCHVQNCIYIPRSMDITTVDCSLVQEGDDNVDKNCQTIEYITCNGGGTDSGRQQIKPQLRR